MLQALDVIAPGIHSRDTLLYGIEVKFYSSHLQLTNALETKIQNMFTIGDGAGVSCCWRRTFGTPRKQPRCRRGCFRRQPCLGEQFVAAFTQAETARSCSRRRSRFRFASRRTRSGSAAQVSEPAMKQPSAERPRRGCFRVHDRRPGGGGLERRPPSRRRVLVAPAQTVARPALWPLA